MKLVENGIVHPEALEFLGSLRKKTIGYAKFVRRDWTVATEIAPTDHRLLALEIGAPLEPVLYSESKYKIHDAGEFSFEPMPTLWGKSSTLLYEDEVSRQTRIMNITETLGRARLATCRALAPLLVPYLTQLQQPLILEWTLALTPPSGIQQYYL